MYWLREIEFSDGKDIYSIPWIQDTLDCLQCTVWFTLLDWKSGYWQVELEEASKDLTAFMVGPLGSMNLSKCNVLAPYGDLFGQPAILMVYHIIYIDDIIIFATTPKEHLESLWAVLSQLWSAGLKLQPTKCTFFKVYVVYLGHVISREGIQTNGCKVKAIKNWPVPITVT